jgi:hypothetical protein
MANAQAFVFDAYGTLFDVHSVVVALQGLTVDAESVSTLWRAKQLEYSWLRSLMGRYVDFWIVTDEALQCALNRFGIEVTPAQHAAMLDAYLHLGLQARRHVADVALNDLVTVFQINVTDKLHVPALDAFRNFCFSPQAALKLMISDIDRLSVAESNCMTSSTFPLG